MRNLGIALCESLVFSRGNDCLLHEIWHAIAERDHAVGNRGFNLDQIKIIRAAWLRGMIPARPYDIDTNRALLETVATCYANEVRRIYT